MANDRKRKEATRNRMREQRTASRNSQSEEHPVVSNQDQQASCSSGKRQRLDSSSDSSVSIRSGASTASERTRKHRANMTEEQKTAVRAKDAERKRKSRGNKTEDQKAAELERDVERIRRNREDLTMEQKSTDRAKDAERKSRNRENMTEEHQAAELARDVERIQQSRANMSFENSDIVQAKNTSARRYARSITPSESTERSNLARREHRHELSEMRESFPTPPTSITTTTAQTTEEGFRIPFFQSTKGECYCRTALNNALGGNVFSFESLGVANIDNVNVEMSEAAVQAKLESMGVRCDSMNNIRDLVTISEIDSVGTWILRNNTTGGHYVVLKRFLIDSPLWLLDSARRAPVVSASYFYDITENLRSEDDLRNLFLLFIRFPDGYVPQCIRDRSEVSIRRMMTTTPSNISVAFGLINSITIS